jgi:hypothetical protein
MASAVSLWFSELLNKISMGGRPRPSVRNGRLASVARRVGRRKTSRRQLPAAPDVLDDGLPIDRHGQCAPHKPVVQDRPRHVHPEKISAEIRIDPQQLRAFAAIAIDAVHWDRIGHVQLPGTKGALLHVVAVDRVKDHGAERNRLRVPVSRAFLHANAIVQPPLLQRERAIAHEATRPRPAAAPFESRSVFSNGREMDRIPRIMAKQ